jgi:hypothetical protein
LYTIPTKWLTMIWCLKGLIDLFGITAWLSGNGWTGETPSQLCTISLKPMITRSCGTVACTEGSEVSAGAVVGR